MPHLTAVAVFSETGLCLDQMPARYSISLSVKFPRFCGRFAGIG
jgi:hypothetical protein